MNLRNGHGLAKVTPNTRRTPQRDAIERVIGKSAGPLTVREIFDRARRRCGMGIATVYRAVSLLNESGQVKAVILADGQTRYEAAHLGHHHHFRCRRCCRVFDLDVCPVALAEPATLPGGFRVDGHELTLYGKCPGCNRRRSRSR